MKTNVGPLHVLFLCTGNSARSQMAEAMLQSRRDDRLVAGSAGTRPAERVNPYALEELRTRGIEWTGRPKTIDEVAAEPWELVITVCDNAKEECPFFPGRPMMAHWGVADPAAVEGDEQTVRSAFRDAAAILARRIELLVALPLEQMDAAAVQAEVRAIGNAGESPR